MEICAMPEAWSWAWIGEKLWDMPGGVGSLIGAAVGLFAVALAARMGFKHLITSQEHQAELNRQRDDRLRDEDCKTVAIEVQAEIVALMSQAAVAKRSINVLRTSGQDMTAGSLSIMEIPTRSVPPGASHRFGLLGPDLCYLVMTAYVAAATIGQVYAELRALESSRSLDDGLVTQLQDLFAILETACQRADRALAEVTGKYFDSPPAIEPPK